jgi:molybdopterin converting factor small subunit
MNLTIEIRFLGVLQSISGKKGLNLKIKKPTTVKKVLDKLYPKFSVEFKKVLVDSQINDPRPNVLILVGGKEVSALNGLETEIKGDEQMVLIPMIHGG